MKPIFVTGLPRTGSTLLLNILAQNPGIYVRHNTCPVSVIIRDVKNGWHGLDETRAMPNEDSYGLLKSMLRGILYGSFAGCKKPYFVTKSRGWLNLIETLNEIVPEKPKFIVCVHSIPEILASIELKNRQSRALGLTKQEAQAGVQFLSLSNRCEYWMAAEQLVGGPYLSIQDTLNKSEYRDQLLVVTRTELTHAPRVSLERIYNFLGMECFRHDFNHVGQIVFEDARPHGFRDLHTIRNKVEPVKPRAVNILGKELTEHYQKYDVLWSGV